MAKNLRTFNQAQANALINLLWSQMRKEPGFHGARVQTMWGSKTKLGLVATIERICLAPESLDSEMTADAGVRLPAPDHVLEVVSYSDGILECSCGRWHLVRTGPVTREEAEREHYFHEHGCFPEERHLTLQGVRS